MPNFVIGVITVVVVSVLPPHTSHVFDMLCIAVGMLNVFIGLSE